MSSAYSGKSHTKKNKPSSFYFLCARLHQPQRCGDDFDFSDPKTFYGDGNKYLELQELYAGDLPQVMRYPALHDLTGIPFLIDFVRDADMFGIADKAMELIREHETAKFFKSLRMTLVDEG